MFMCCVCIFSLRQFGIELVFPEQLKDFLDMLGILLQGFAINQNVIHKDYDKLPKKKVPKLNSLYTETL
jgi:hypothetical protein